MDCAFTPYFKTVLAVLALTVSQPNLRSTYAFAPASPSVFIGIPTHNPLRHKSHRKSSSSLSDVQHFPDDSNNSEERRRRRHLLPIRSRRSTLATMTLPFLFLIGLDALPSDATMSVDETSPFLESPDNDGPPSLYLAQPMGPASGKTSKTVTAPSPAYLVPAARVKVYVDTLVATAEAIDRQTPPSSSLSSSATTETTTPTVPTAVLGRLLTAPPSFIRPADPPRKTRSNTAAGSSGDGSIVSDWEAARKKQKERDDRQIVVGLAPRTLEVFELSGERRQWNRLQRQERAREEASEVRKALNIYTTNLVFDEERYKFKGSKEEKSRLIRDDKLPSVNDVIRSDLDLRDLFRNELQTALEDARAEYDFQIRGQEKGEVFDVGELRVLLGGAQVACDKWFSFVDEGEAKLALEAAQRESMNW
mmetsp:Transcript_51988/g.62536  ORF Transcript_51988/g.62536 Transcript_51988/m.62536 type:complete len:421 (-) Transcript_51988:66-1328(-)